MGSSASAWPPAEAAGLRVASFNVLHGRDPQRLVAHPGRLAAACAGLGADVLALQEVDQRVIRSRFADLTARVSTASGMQAVFGPTRRLLLTGRYGNALFVRGRIDGYELVRLPGGRGSEPRAMILALAVPDTTGAPLSVGATHLSTRRVEALEQLAAVLEALTRRPGPHLLLGDLNLEPADVGPVVTRGGLTLAGGPPTFPATSPRRRIDHVAVGGLRLGLVDAPVVAMSDHRPLLADLALPG